MSAITIVGGVYHERCIWPDWDQIYGSGGRAAAALAGQVDKISLHAYARKDIASAFSKYAALYGFEFLPRDALQAISFEYVHSMSVPVIRPAPASIQMNAPFAIQDEVAVRFGILEGSAVVDADWCVYDPQSAFNPRPFNENGSRATHLAIVANRGEALTLTNQASIEDAASALLRDGAEVVVVKSGPEGARVFDSYGISSVPAFCSQRVWTIGSGDVFAAIFAAEWALNKSPPTAAALVASRAVAEYANTAALPIPGRTHLAGSTLPEATGAPGHIYLASPFFTLGQRWLVDDARRCLRELGMNVFSPVHDVGHGMPQEIAPADLKALDECDAVFAIIDGIDSGTLFEVGYARARNKPVYALAQAVSEEDLKMLNGSGCRVFGDYVTALHYLVWRA